MDAGAAAGKWGWIKKALKRAFCLPPALTAYVSIPSFGLFIYVLAAKVGGAIATAAYMASAYAAAVLAVWAVRLSWKVVETNPFAQQVLAGPFGQRYLKDEVSRAELSLYAGLVFNLLNAAAQLVLGIYHRSLWYGSLAAFYILLSVIRFLLSRYVNTHTAGQDIRSELRQYRLCGVLLLFITPALAIIFVAVLHRNSGFEYPGILIYVMAVYAFCSVIVAAANVVRFKKIGSPVMDAAKAISLTKALVSMLALETAMLSRFGGGDGTQFHQALLGTTGGGVCVFVLGMALYMVVYAAKELKKR